MGVLEARQSISTTMVRVAPDGLSPAPSMGDTAGSAIKGHAMPFPIWQSIPPTTPLQDLYRTSLLMCSDAPGSEILLRCSSGLEDGRTTVVHATARRPDALRMVCVGDDTQIAEQAQMLLGDSKVHVVAVPPIAWKTLGGGLPRRTRIAAVIALLTGILLCTPPITLSPWVAVPLALGLGLLVRLLLRERIPTRIVPTDTSTMTVEAVVSRVMLSLHGVPAAHQEGIDSQAGCHRWAPPVG